MSASTRRRAKRLASRLGIERQARALYTLLQPAAVRRDRRDHARLVSILERTLTPDSCCLDVGAHEGAVLREIERLAPRGSHIAWEPLPEHARRLAEAHPAVDVRAAALSDRSGERDFAHVVTRPGWSGFRPRPTPGDEEVETITVVTERLDDAVPDGFVPAFVKIDVEGAELEVLRGAIDTLCTHRPLVAFEHGLGSADHYGTRPEQVHDLLVGEAGLRISVLGDAEPLTRDGFAAVFARGERVNFLARP